jgi:hypothetical protein
MSYREMVVLCSEINTKHLNALCGQKLEFFYVKPCGNYSNPQACTQLVLFLRAVENKIQKPQEGGGGGGGRPRRF